VTDFDMRSRWAMAVPVGEHQAGGHQVGEHQSGGHQAGGHQAGGRALHGFLPRQRAKSARAAPADGRLRVVHIAKHCGYANGSVHVAVDLACLQARAGYDVLFVSGGGTFVEMLRQHGVRHITMRQDQRNPFTLLRAAIGLLAVSRRLRPTVLHAHMMGGAVIGYATSVVTGIPLVTTVHNSFDWHSILMRLGHRVVAVSKAERDHLIERGYDAQRVAVIWNAPINSPRETFMRNASDIALARPCIVAACALHRRKGVFDLIDAYATLLPDFPDWRLYIAGEGPDSDALAAQAAALGIADRVTFLGFIADPRTLYRQSDIFVLASYADPGSLSIGEARAAGCAIVATAVGGTAEMLDHGAAGRLIPPGAPQRLAAELRTLMRDPAARAALSEAAISGAEIFDVHRLVGDYERVYHEALRR
jgi:glycosyltransferase involved in cell wall biosynthesis